MLEKALISVKDNQTKIPVMFNPTELSDNRKMKLKGKGSNLQFDSVVQEDFQVSLFFDTSERATDVKIETSKIATLMSPTIGAESRKTPPVVIFSWFDTWFEGVISQLKQKFTMFLPSGMPIRARLELTLQSVLSEKQELKSLGLPNCRKLTRVDQSDRLDLLAYQETGASSFWRQIAIANDLENPLSFPLLEQCGSMLVIPDFHTRETDS